jgi:hypothetical protein
MKSFLFTLTLICLANATFGSSVWCGIEITKGSVFTIQEGEQLKLIVPQYSDWINSYILALKQGMTVNYNVSIWLDQNDDAIRSAYVLKPNGQTVTLHKEDPGSFTNETDGPNIFYTSIENLKANWPSGDYVLYVTFADGHTQTWTTTIPDYDTTPFPDIVSGSLTTDSQGQLLLNWNTVNNVYNYNVWGFEFKKFKDVYDSDMYYSGLQSVETPMTGVYASKGDYNFGVAAYTHVVYGTNGEFTVGFNSEAEWFSFKNPVPAKQNILTKSTVAAGKSVGMGDISFSGTLDAIEADFSLAIGDVVEVGIESDLMANPQSLTFPINNSSFKKGKFSNKTANTSFALDTKTGKMAFSAKNVNLTGIACPITVTITIGDYEAEFKLSETAVNGTKLCPPQLMMGVKNSLTVDKYSFKHGKTAGTNSFTAQGTFTIDGSADKNNPLVITLGTQTITVPGILFPAGKAGIESCKKAASTEGPIVDAKFDFVKCTYTISVKNASISENGPVDFEINCFGVNLEGFATVNIN